MSSALFSDWTAMGLDYYGTGRNAFQAAAEYKARYLTPEQIKAIEHNEREKARSKEKRRREGLKTAAQRAADSLMTEGERKAAKILRDNSGSGFSVRIACAQERDKTSAIRGRL